MTRPTVEPTFWFLPDDAAGFAWVRGDISRGKAVAMTADHFEERFVDCRARRLWARWRHLEKVVGWAFPDGTLAPCEKDEDDAQPFWEVVVVRKAR